MFTRPIQTPGRRRDAATREAVDALAADEGLGACLDVRSRGVRWFWTTFAVAVFAAAATWPFRGRPGSPWVMAVLVVWAVTQARTSTLFNPRLRRQRCFLFEAGLVVVGSARTIRLVRWSEVLMVTSRIQGWQFWPPRFHHASRCEVVPAAGPVLTFGTEWRRLATLMLMIRTASTTAQLPEVLAALRQGAEVRFGDIIVSAVGVRTPAGAAAWTETTPMVLTRQNRLRIETPGALLPLVSTPVSALPNPTLLLTVVKLCQDKKV